MSREFKFRVYVKELRKFIYFELGEFLHPERYLNQDGVNIQQFTGTKDAKGNPIYEGDILERQNTSYYYKVEYCEKNAAYICRDCDGGFVYLSDFEYIVIGNTYDKPPCNFDHNLECLVCDGWSSDCPFTKFK